MEIEKVLRLAIQHIGNNRYNEARDVLQDKLDSMWKEPVEEVKIEEEEKYPDVKEEKYTERELYGFNKDMQIEILKKLGSEKIPRFESGRVKLILRLQG